MHRRCRLCIYKAEQLFTTGWMTYAEIVFRYIHSTKLESERGPGVAKKIAELFVEVLAAAGVERIYGVAGDSLNGITDSIRRLNGIGWVGVRHEETAAFAAGAEAALSGKLP